jgi:hypothetical protein
MFDISVEPLVARLLHMVVFLRLLLTSLPLSNFVVVVVRTTTTNPYHPQQILEKLAPYVDLCVDDNDESSAIKKIHARTAWLIKGDKK